MRRGKIEAVRAFFRANPSEELGLRDIEAKFDVSYKRACTIAETLAREGLVESVHVVRLKPCNKLQSK